MADKPEIEAIFAQWEDLARNLTPCRAIQTEGAGLMESE
jgi:hypothetical protein